MCVKKMMYSILFLLVTVFTMNPLMVKAVETTNHTYMVIDEEDFLSDEEEQGLITRMKEHVPYGNCMILLLSDNSIRTTEKDTIQYAEQLYIQTCSYTDGLVFVIDMSTRFIELVTMENYRNQISNYEASSICDGVYQYASDGDFYGCCEKALIMVDAKLNVDEQDQNAGKIPAVKVPQSMHIVTNILLALVIALILNFFLLKYLSRTPEASAEALANSADVNIKIQPGNHTKVKSETISYDLGSLEGIIGTRNWFGKLIHLIVFILILAVRIGGSGGSSGSSGGSSSRGSSGGGHSGGGGHRF